jgi:peroxiredoxin
MATAALQDLRLPDTDGNEVRLADFWASGPVVVVWLRHYG